MKTMRNAAVAFAAIFALTAAGHAFAEGAKQKALQEGAESLSSEQILGLLLGKTGTWVSASGEKTVLIHYGRNNKLSGKLVGGDWSGSGYWAVTNDDSVCISWDQIDKDRLRCLDVVVANGVVQKFNPDGSLNGTYEGFKSGKSF